MLHAKNYENWPMFHEAIQKIKLARFLWITVYRWISKIHDAAHEDGSGTT